MNGIRGMGEISPEGDKKPAGMTGGFLSLIFFPVAGEVFETRGV